MSNPFFFLHIPKTAGTTLNTILDDNFPSGDILDIYTGDQVKALADMTYDRISRYALVRGHLFIGEFKALLDGPVPFRVFSFLRDPVKRVVSEYHFLKSWPKSHLYSYLNQQDISLTEYVTSDDPLLRRRGRNAMVNSLSGVGGETVEERLEMAWYHLKERFVTFGILERFNESLLLLKRVMGLGGTFYEKQNVRTPSVVDEILPHEVELIRELNHADIELYERAVVEFDQRIDSLGVAFKAEIHMFDKINLRVQRVSELMNRRAGLVQDTIMNAK